MRPVLLSLPQVFSVVTVAYEALGRSDFFAASSLGPLFNEALYSARDADLPFIQLAMETRIGREKCAPE